MRSDIKLRDLYWNQDLPVYLIQYVTSICNAKCATCFYAHELNTKPASDELSVDEIRKISARFAKLWQVTLGGGEPFLRPELADICEIFSVQNSAGVITIPTNCLQPEETERLAEAFLSRCKNTFFRISLSLDGIGACHDHVRGVPGNFQKLRETHERLVSLRKKHGNLNVDVNTCLSKFNENEILEIIDYVGKELDVDNHDVSYVRGEAREASSKDLSYVMYERAYRTIRAGKRRDEQRPLSILYRALVDAGRQVSLRTLKENRCIVQCHTIKKMVVINEVGRVFGCEILWNALGDLREHDYDIRRILFADKALEEARRIRRERCHCTWECANNLNVLYNANQLLPLVRGVLHQAALKLGLI